MAKTAWQVSYTCHATLAPKVNQLRDAGLKKTNWSDPAGKTQLVLYDQLNNIDAIDVKMDGSVLEEKSFFKILGLIFSSKFG